MQTPPKQRKRSTRHYPKTKKATDDKHFFSKASFQSTTTNLTTGIHNHSTYQLSEQDIALLTKGLSFAPTPNTPTQTLYLQTLYLQTLRGFDDCANL